MEQVQIVLARGRHGYDVRVEDDRISLHSDLDDAREAAEALAEAAALDGAHPVLVDETNTPAGGRH